MIDWFLRAKVWKDIWEGNVRDFYCSTFLEKDGYAELNEEQREKIDRYVAVTEKCLGGLPKDKNNAIRCVRLHSDPLLCEHHPIVFYILTELFIQRAYSFFVLRSYGFQKWKAGKVTYWYHPGPMSNNIREKKEPIIFVPGLGVGECRK